ncbi:MAG: hypothetical protein COZ66_02085 [Candidatus Huberarchaeum crystalense]|uniref:Uncharacterized protein n=1 Tax=Huberarchaeum crystalense TaxID=2014257 RepID=A0A2H9P8G5_HUBC1|nr:MAG: hypothetical protein COZ66_02085 [Candidatus Huberarchaeum crystalense]PIY99806.1 MAG: hypothetical protein COY63_01555 [Candidatus Huberarchaeum crystalense]
MIYYCSLFFSFFPSFFISFTMSSLFLLFLVFSSSSPSSSGSFLLTSIFDFIVSVLKVGLPSLSSFF